MATDYSRFEWLKIDIEDRVALLTIDGAGDYNSVSEPLHAELGDIWPVLDRDPDVNAIVVTGAGTKAFSAGGNLNATQSRDELTSTERYDRIVTDIIRWTRNLIYNMVNCDKPIISAINGVAAGAGTAVALLADISVMAEDTFITDAHTRLGIAAGDHACMIWPLLCGMAKAKYYILTCDRISGVEAERIGLVSMTVPREEVLPKSMEIARRLADGPQFAIRMTKNALNQWLRHGGLISSDYSTALEMLNQFGPDLEAGLRSHLTKTPPVFPSSNGGSGFAEARA
jgi:enoyl-CoA hydratase